ncbi:hypothetical protein L479_00926 [Exiguobacterium sp. S17]|nr:hypothetical protein L479_00926 [Exiguobacterium sp. S17]
MNYKNKYLILLLTLICFFSYLMISTEVVANTNQTDNSVMIILDASGSMGTADRMERAKTAAIEQVNKLKGTNAEVGLTVFYGCGNIRLEHSLTKNHDLLIPLIQAITPSGTTPLADSIAFGGNYLKQNGVGTKGKLIVYTDGGDTCTGNYDSARDAIEGLEIELWGIDLDDSTKTQIEIGLGQDGKLNDLNTPVIEAEKKVLSIRYAWPLETTIPVGEQYVVPNVIATMSDNSEEIVDYSKLNLSSSRLDRLSFGQNSSFGINTIEGLAVGSSDVIVSYEGKVISNTVKVEYVSRYSKIEFETPLPNRIEVGKQLLLPNLIGTLPNGLKETINIGHVDIQISNSLLQRGGGWYLYATATGTSNLTFNYDRLNIYHSIKVDTGPSLLGLSLANSLPDIKEGEGAFIPELKGTWSDGTTSVINPLDVTITSSREDRVGVNQTSLIGKSTGSATINFEYRGKLLQAPVKVVSGPRVTSLSFQQTPLNEIKQGETRGLPNVLLNWSDGTQTVALESDLTISSSRIDRLSTNGLSMTGNDVGSASITVQYQGLNLIHAVKTVFDSDVSSISVSGTIPSLKIGEELNLPIIVATMKDSSTTLVDGTSYKITSSNTSLVSVNAGKIVANGSGTTTLK